MEDLMKTFEDVYKKIMSGKRIISVYKDLEVIDIDGKVVVLIWHRGDLIEPVMFFHKEKAIEMAKAILEYYEGEEDDSNNT